MKCFVDANLSEHLAKGMKAFGEDVIHLKEVFPENTADQEWLKYVGENEMFLITRDEAIRWHPGALYSLRQFKAGAFFLGGKNRSRCELIQQLVRSWPRIKQLAEQTKRPFAFRIPPSGTKFVQMSL